MKTDQLLITIEELSVNNLGKQESRTKLNILSKKQANLISNPPQIARKIFVLAIPLDDSNSETFIYTIKRNSEITRI